MKRFYWGMALIAAPLAALSLALPAGLEAPLPPAWAAGLPLLWAALIVSLAGAPSQGLALGLCLPYSAWSLLYCSVWALTPRPLAADAMELLAAAALFLSAMAWARFKRPGARLLLAFAILLPGLSLQAALGPFAASALAAFATALAALTRRRAEARP